MSDATNHPSEERTFLMIKPDGVMRGLVGEILRRLESRGLKIIALQMEMPTREKIDSHYPKAEAWIRRVGQKTLGTYEKYGYDPIAEFGSTDDFEIGTVVRGWILDTMTAGPIVKVVIQGLHAVDSVRKVVGSTIPANAELGSIRGDFSVDSPALANKEKRSILNLVHASETPEEAAHEIAYWFGDAPVFPYKRTEDALFGNR